MGFHQYVKAQIIIIVISLLCGCKPTTDITTDDQSSIPNTTTAVPTTNDPISSPSATTSQSDESVVLLHTLSGHNNAVLDVAFSSGGELLASSSRDLGIKLWNVGSGIEVNSFQMTSVDMADIDIYIRGNLLASGEAIWDLDRMQEILVMERGLPYPAHVAFSPDGSTLALGLFDQQLTLWDVEGGKPTYTFDKLEEKQTKRMDFSHDGTLLAVGVMDGAVRVLDIETGEIVKVLKFSGETDIHDVVFSPDGKYLATGGRVPAVVLWDVESGEIVRTFSLTDNAIRMAFSPDGKILAAAGGIEYGVQLWDVESGALLLSIPHDEQNMAIAISPDGKLLAVGSLDHNIYLWQIPTTP